MNQNLKFRLALGGVLCVLWGASARAENNTTNIVSSTLFNNAGAVYYVGNTGASNYLEINSAGVLTNATDVNIGNLTNTANFNSALVTGSSSALYASSRVIVGWDGSFNSLTIANGGSVSNNGANTYIGRFGTNNTVLVTGTNSTWRVNSSGDFRIGSSSANNRLIVTNGGVVRCFTPLSYISVSSVGNNSVLVTGPGSAWQNTNDLRVGGNGTNNSLSIANGGTVTNTLGNVGASAGTANFNWVLVSDTNSLWKNGACYVGNLGANNSLTISNGGMVTSTGNSIGNNNVNASNNWVLVTGGGSRWVSSGNTIVGNQGSSNSLTIINGGTVTNTGSGIVGNTVGSSNNAVLVTGAGSAWLNAGALYVGTNGSGNSLTIANGGLVASGAPNIGYTSTVNTTANNNNNTVLVTGAGSLWQSTGNGNLGGFGAFNRLIISNGASAYFVSANIFLGGANSHSNSVLVTDSGSVFQNTGILSAGNNGVGHSLTIANGGKVINSSNVLVGVAGASQSNSITVTGVGSILELAGTNGAYLHLGYHATTVNNVLNVGNGGLLTNMDNVTLGGVNSVFNLGDGAAAATLAAGSINLSVANAQLNINNGVFRATAAGSISGAGSVDIAAGGAVVDSQTNSVTVSSSISGTGGLTKLGLGALTLSGTDSYAGSTTVSNGTLLVNGILGSGPVSVKTGATLGGAGIIAGTVAVDAGGTLQAGLGGLDTGTLSISNNLALSGNALFTLNRTNAQTAAKIIGLTNVSYGGTLTLTNSGPALQAGDSFSLIQSAVYSGSFGSVVLPSLTTGLVWNANNLAVSGSVSVQKGSTTITLASSENPSGFHDNVAFSATVDQAGATGWLVFATNGVAASTNAMVAGSATNTTVGGSLPRGTNVIAVVYSGDANYLASTNTLLQIVTNHPPAANDSTYGRGAVSNWHIPVADLLTNATDSIDGDALTLVSLDVSTNGITLYNDGAMVGYTNTNLVADQFTYTVTDGFGGTNSGVITLTASNNVTGTSSIAGVITGNPTTLTAYGIPGETYITQRATNLDQVAWDDIATNVLAGTNVVISVTDSNPPPGAAYYRLKWQP